MALSRRELFGYAVAGATGMGITAAAQADSDDADSTGDPTQAVDDHEQPGFGRAWELGRVQTRPAEIRDTSVTFRAAARSSYDTDYEVRVALFYRPKPGQREQTPNSGATVEWRPLGEQTALLSEGVYFEVTERDLETGTTYQYHAQAVLTNYDGPSRRVSQIREVTAGQPCSGPSTNCLRVETLAPDVSASGEGVTLRATVRGLDAYDEVTGHFFYWREGESKQWTEYVRVDGDSTSGSASGEFSATLSGVPAGTYTCYAEARGEGGGANNMYAEGEKQQFTVE